MAIAVWKVYELYSPLLKQFNIWKDIINKKSVNTIAELMEELLVSLESPSTETGRDSVDNRIGFLGEFLEASGAFKVILNDNNQKYSFNISDLCTSEYNPFFATEKDLKQTYRINYNNTNIEALARSIDCENKVSKIATAQIFNILSTKQNPQPDYIINKEQEYLNILTKLRESSVLSSIKFHSDGIENEEVLRGFILKNFPKIDINSFRNFKDFSQYVIAKRVREASYLHKNLDIKQLLYEYKKDKSGVFIFKNRDCSTSNSKLEDVLNIYIKDYNQHFSVHLPKKLLTDFEQRNDLILPEETIDANIKRSILTKKTTYSPEIIQTLRSYGNLELSNFLDYYELMHLSVTKPIEHSILSTINAVSQRENQIARLSSRAKYLNTRYPSQLVPEHSK